MSEESQHDTLGWGFFGIAFLISLAPCTYVVFQATIDSTPMAMRIFSGVFLAMFAAGIISWIANSILGYVGDRRAARQGVPRTEHDSNEE